MPPVLDPHNSLSALRRFKGSVNRRAGRVLSISFCATLSLFFMIALAADNPTVKLKLKNNDYRLELADTPRRRILGLMHRTSLEADQGMLFLYTHSGEHQIWMKNTLIPLTVIWLDAQAQILKLELLQPCNRDPCPSYGAGVQARYVLELHAQAHTRFKPGDHLPALLDLPH